MSFKDIKDPGSTADFSIDWSDLLGESSPVDTISSSSWTVDNDATITAQSSTDTTATAWISGGNDRKYCQLTNEVETTAGRIYQRTVAVKIQQR